MSPRSTSRVLVRIAVLLAVVVLLVSGDLGPVMIALGAFVLVVNLVGLVRELAPSDSAGR